VPGHLSIREIHCDIRNDLRADPSLALLLVKDPSARGAERFMVEIYRRFPRYNGQDVALTSWTCCSAMARRCSCIARRARTARGSWSPCCSMPSRCPATSSWKTTSRRRGGRGASRIAHPSPSVSEVIVPPTALDSAVDAVLSVRELYLESALSAVMSDYGSIEQYLESEAGLDDSRRERLRAHLLA